MKKRCIKLSLLVILAVVALLAVSCLLVACGDKEKPVEDPPADVVDPPKSTTKVIITIEGVDTDKQYTLEYGQSLTLRKYDRAHYDFDYYTFTAPNGKDYTSEQDGQLWKSADDDRAKLLNWNWEVSTVRIAAHFTPKEYTVKVYGTPTDPDYEYTNILLDKVTYDAEFPDDFIRSVTSKRNKDVGYEFIGITSRNSISDADSFASRSAEILNEKDYVLDDRAGVCKLFFNYERASYTLAFMDYNYNNNRYSSLGGASERSVKYGETVCLSDLMGQLSVTESADVKRYNKYVHIGWNRTSPTPGNFSSDTVDYTLNANFSFDNADVNRVELYAIWAPLPCADDLVLTVEGLQASVTGADETQDIVEFYYSTSEAGGRRPLRNGDLSGLPTDIVYTVSVDVYRYYTAENVEARVENAVSKKVRSVSAPTLTIQNDTLSAGLADPSFVGIVLDGKDLGALSEQDEYFLRDEKGGAHTVFGYYAYTAGEVACQSVLGNALTFNVRAAGAKIRIEASTIFLTLSAENTPSVWDATAIIKRNLTGNYEAEEELGEFTTLNQNGYFILTEIDYLLEGGYIVCDVILAGDNSSNVSKHGYAKIRKENGVFFVTEENENGDLVERTLN